MVDVRINWRLRQDLVEKKLTGGFKKPLFFKLTRLVGNEEEKLLIQRVEVYKSTCFE